MLRNCERPSPCGPLGCVDASARPAATISAGCLGVSSPAISALLDRLEEKSVECRSLMVVRPGHIVAEGGWAPDSADRPPLLYSLTESFTSIAVGLAIADG